MSSRGRVVRVATRASALARWQADHVAALLVRANPGLAAEIVPVSTEGDRRTDVPLWTIGGKGVFSKEVQRAVLDGRADVAVHSAKDLPAITPDGLVIAAVPLRGDPRDALVGSTVSELAESVRAGRPTVVATGSARRRVQLAGVVPGLRFEELRGNMATRLERSVDFDAIVVAAAALERLDLADRLDEVLAESVLVPQVGQGALAVECRADDEATSVALHSIDHPSSRLAVEVERAFLAELGGDCSLPAGAHCRLDDRGAQGSGDPGVQPALTLEAVLAGSVEPGSAVARGSRSAEAGAAEPERIGRELAAALRAEVEEAA